MEVRCYTLLPESIIFHNDVWVSLLNSNKKLFDSVTELVDQTICLKLSLIKGKRNCRITCLKYYWANKTSKQLIKNYQLHFMKESMTNLRTSGEGYIQFCISIGFQFNCYISYHCSHCSPKSCSAPTSCHLLVHD